MKIHNVNFSEFEKVVTRPYSPLKAFAIHNGNCKYLGLFLPAEVKFTRNLVISDTLEKGTIYAHAPQAALFRKKVAECAKDLGWCEHFVKTTYAVCEGFVAAAKQLSALDFKIPGVELAELYSAYLDAFERWGPSATVVWIVETVLEEALIKLLEKKDILAPEKLAALIAPEQVPPSSQLQGAILKAAIAIIQGSNKEQEAAALAKEYSWIPMDDYFMTPCSTEFFENKITEVLSGNPESELKKIQSARQALLEQRAKLEIELKLSAQERQLVELMRCLSYLRTYRTDMLRKAIWFAVPFLKEVSERLGWSLEEVCCLLPNELLTLLSLDLDTIRSRKSGFLYVFADGNANISVNEQKITEAKAALESEQEQVIRGRGASPGFAKGIVKVITSAKELSKIEEGDILVARWTSPEYTTAFGKAAAIVTDEGGLTSHAAIVSREMRKPCIVGTKVATKLLQDGMLITVDAEKGIVEKIK